jgi:hypothetical protein
VNCSVNLLHERGEVLKEILRVDVLYFNPLPVEGLIIIDYCVRCYVPIVPHFLTLSESKDPFDSEMAKPVYMSRIEDGTSTVRPEERWKTIPEKDWV